VAAGFAFRPVVGVADDEPVPVEELAVVAAAESTVLGGDAEPVL